MGYHLNEATAGEISWYSPSPKSLYLLLSVQLQSCNFYSDWFFTGLFVNCFFVFCFFFTSIFLKLDRNWGEGGIEGIHYLIIHSSDKESTGDFMLGKYASKRMTSYLLNNVTFVLPNVVLLLLFDKVRLRRYFFIFALIYQTTITKVNVRLK